MKSHIKTLFTLALLMHAGSLTFAVYANDAQPIKRFDIRPAICVVELDADCHSRFIFSWELAYATQVCLTAHRSGTEYLCDDRTQVEVELVLNLSESDEYSLMPANNPYQKMTRRIDIQRLNKDVRILHRRIWSVF